MHDKIGLINDWFRSLGKQFVSHRFIHRYLFLKELSLKIEVGQSSVDTDSFDQLQNKLKQFTTEIESLKSRGIGKNSTELSH